MSRALSVLSVVVVVLLAMGFAAANAGNHTALALGFLHLYRVPVTLVAFGGFFVGMVLMFVAGIHSDLKVRRILRERLVEESHQEQVWIDRDQRDLFSQPTADSEPLPLPDRMDHEPSPAPSADSHEEDALES